MSHAIAAVGSLVAIGGRSEGLTLDGKPDPAQPNFVSLWDAHPRASGWQIWHSRPVISACRPCCSRPTPDFLYAFVASPSQTQLYVWRLAPEWSALGTK